MVPPGIKATRHLDELLLLSHSSFRPSLKIVGALIAICQIANYQECISVKTQPVSKELPPVKHNPDPDPERVSFLILTCSSSRFAPIDIPSTGSTSLLAIASCQNSTIALFMSRNILLPVDVPSTGSISPLPPPQSGESCSVPLAGSENS